MATRRGRVVNGARQSFDISGHQIGGSGSSNEGGTELGAPSCVAGAMPARRAIGTKAR